MDSQRVIRSLRLQLLIERIAIAVIALIFLTTWAVGRFGDGKSLILVDGKAVACVSSQKDAQVVLKEIKSNTGYNPSEVKFQQEVRVARAPRDARPVSRHKAIAAVRNVVRPTVAGWSVVVNGKPMVALTDRETAGEVLELAKMKFGSAVKNLAEEPEFKEQVTVDVAAVPVERYFKTAEEAVEHIFSNKPAQMTDGTYTVKNGDIAVLIARRHSISLEQLEKLNPGVNLARLSIGDQINIKKPTETEPKLTVVVRDQSERVETVPAPVQRVSSAKLYTGQSYEIQPGEAGRRKVKVATIYENGRRVGTEIIAEEILKEPVPRRVAMGIKTRR